MKTLLLFTFVLLAGCGSKAKLEIVQTAPGEYLTIDRNCTAIIRKVPRSRKKRRSMMGSRLNAFVKPGDYILKESEGFCHDSNLTLGEHISEMYNMEGVFKDGERVWIWSDESMEKVLKYMIKHGTAHIEEEE